MKFEDLWEGIWSISAIIIFIFFLMAYLLHSCTGKNPYAEFCQCNAQFCEECGKVVRE